MTTTSEAPIVIRSFGEELKVLRMNVGVSQSKLAEIADFDHSYVSRLESGARTPTREAISRLSDALRIDDIDRRRLLASASHLNMIEAGEIMIDLSDDFIGAAIAFANSNPPAALRSAMTTILKAAFVANAATDNVISQNGAARSKRNRYPLQWPDGWPRTGTTKRSNFMTTIFDARIKLANELRLLGAKDIVITSNADVNKDGSISAKQRWIADQGVAVYFLLDGQERCIPCDRWDDIADNLHAIELSVNALRGLSRWGAKQMVDAAFAGFSALPAGAATANGPSYWWDVLGVDQNATRAEIDAAYRKRAKELHPDTNGGDSVAFIEVSDAYSVAKEIVG